MKALNSLDEVDRGILRILSGYEQMACLELWYELGEDDALKERVTEAEVGTRLESLRKKGFLERVKEAEVESESRRPIYRITKRNADP